MAERLLYILRRIDSRHLAKLWSFYRNYFSDDDLCLSFIYEALAKEPENDGSLYHELDKMGGSFVNDKGAIIYDSDFIPRRMLNALERLVTAARDMDQIRRGKDIFKVVFLVTCVETLQGLGGNKASKKDLLFTFFKNYANEDDRKYIAEHFAHDDEECCDETEDSFEQFLGVLNEYRNCATHEGEYWDFCFNNNQDEYPIHLVINIDLEKFSPHNKKEHCFRTSISYNDFESVFIRTCINYIKAYVNKNA